MRVSYLFVVSVCWAKCPSDTVCDESFKRCYKYVDRGQPYFAAEEDCISLGGHLASVENMFENAVIGETADSMFTGYNDYWIGANYIIENKWSWTDETTWSFINWFPGEPSDQTVVSVMVNGHQWTTSGPDNSKPYVCEMPFSAGGVTVSEPSFTTSPSLPPMSTCAHIPHCQSEWTYFAGANSCFNIFFNQAFYDAEEICVQHGAHLTSIHSDEENEFVMHIASTGHGVGGSDTTWIGLHQVAEEWMWIDGTVISYTAWGPGSRAAGKCGRVYPMGWSGGGGWNSKWDADDCADLATMGRAVGGLDPTWIGLHQAQNQWYWTDGTQTSYFSWGAWSGPGNCIGIFPSGCTCASGWTNKWYQFPCLDQLRNFVCKKPAL